VQYKESKNIYRFFFENVKNHSVNSAISKLNTADFEISKSMNHRLKVKQNPGNNLEFQITTPQTWLTQQKSDTTAHKPKRAPTKRAPHTGLPRPKTADSTAIPAATAQRPKSIIATTTAPSLGLVLFR